MGLYDRNYMRYNSTSGFSPAATKSMLWKIIGVNVIIYMLVGITSGPQAVVNGKIVVDFGSVFHALALSTTDVLGVKFYTLISAGFLHENFWHLFFNMWSLYIFGSMIVRHLSWQRLIGLYLSGTIAGNLLFLLFNFDTPNILYGASGACFAVMIAAAMLEPNQRLMLILLPMFPLKTKTLVICFTILELMQNNGGSSSVAHLAHLGGFVGGLIYIKCLSGLILGWDPLKFIKRSTPKFPRNDNGFNPKNYRSSDWSKPAGDFKADSGKKVTQRDLDYLLDKVSRNGINSLSPEELAMLKKAREQMKGQGQ